MGLISEEQVKSELENLPGWSFETNSITKTFELKDFQASLDFVNKVAQKAESANHHPDIEIHYNKVTLVLSSHDSGGVTDRDFDLAAKIEEVA